MPVVHTGKLEASEIAGDLSNAVLGHADGYKIARGEVTPAEAEKDITTGLTTVVAVCAVMEDNPGVGAGDAAVVSAEIGAVAGHATLKSWQDDYTSAASANWLKILWIAVGT